MSKCNLPARQVDAVIDGVAGKKRFDACDGTYLGSVVPDPTEPENVDRVAPATVKRSGQGDGILSYGT